MRKISIIVPVYQAEKYISKCIESIINQTYKNLEIILIDDGSMDSSGEICDRYGERDQRIVVVHNPNKGVSAARNCGLDIATGDYITFVDSDDWIHPRYLEFLYNGVCSSQGKISICEFVRTNKWEEYPLLKKSSVDFVRTEQYYFENNTNFIVAWGKLYHRDCFKGIRYPVGRIHEDEFTTYKILLNLKN